MMIDDGTGTGRKAKVNLSNRLETDSSTTDSLEVLNEQGSVWSLPIDAVVPSGATKFFYLLNNGVNIVGVAAVRIATSVAGVYRFIKVTGTAGGGTAVTAVPNNLGSSTPPPAGGQKGTDITGLTEAACLLPMYCAANTFYEFSLPSRWYLTPNTAIAIQAPATATVNGSLLIFIEEES